uniref:Uncharacterized protein n=1 Tax=Tetraselmis sp. GSL018 TaxID=582737 RepID=A0A061RU45_9CHLO
MNDQDACDIVRGELDGNTAMPRVLPPAQLDVLARSSAETLVAKAMQ